MNVSAETKIENLREYPQRREWCCVWLCAKTTIRCDHSVGRFIPLESVVRTIRDASNFIISEGPLVVVVLNRATTTVPTHRIVSVCRVFAIEVKRMKERKRKKILEKRKKQNKKISFILRLCFAPPRRVFINDNREIRSCKTVRAYVNIVLCKKFCTKERWTETGR